MLGIGSLSLGVGSAALTASAAFLATTIASVGCGSSQARTTTPSAEEGPDAHAPTQQASEADTTHAPPTTTTETLEGERPGTGTRLAESRTPAIADGGAAAASHTHDPGRGPKDVQALVVAHDAEIRSCRERALQEHPDLSGELVVTWVIDPKGNVSGTAVDESRSTVSDAGLFDCVSGVVKRIQFAPSPGGFETRTSYPFRIHPRHSKTQP